MEQATPAIEQFLLNERKREVIAKDLKKLRDAANIEYAGNDVVSGKAPVSDASASASASASDGTGASPVPKGGGVKP
jgi:hypothetical protein